MHDPTTLNAVQSGMKVVDSAGDEIGTVGDVSMGDPEAATTAGNEPRPTGGVMGDVAAAITRDRGEPHVPEPLRSRLVREGYIKIDAGVLGSATRYASAEQVERVDRDRVVLNVTKEALDRRD
jgi:hypothetical protein